MDSRIIYELKYIISKKEFKTINDIREEDATMMGYLFLAARDIAKNIGIDESGYRLIMNCNKDGGQEVFYTHMHLVGAVL